MEAKYLEIGGRTYYAFEEPDFVGPRELWSPSNGGEPANISVPTLENYDRKGFLVGKRFDWLFGVVMPVACIFFDPAVFTGNFLGERPWLGAVKPAAYALSFVSILAMMAWLIWGERLRGFSVVLSGLFAMAGLGSFLIGLAIMPLSLLGLIIVIGVFGFTPFLTAIVMFRNAERSYNAARSFLDQSTVMYSFILMLLASAVFPYLVQLAVGR
jgi:hypothetical protein